MEVEMFDYDYVMFDYYNNQKTNNFNNNNNNISDNNNKNKNNLLFEFQQNSSGNKEQVIDEDDIIKSPSKKNAKLDKYGFVVTDETPDEDIIQENSGINNEKENYREAGKRIAREQKWIHIVNNWNDFLINQPEKLLYLSSKGIPNNLRSIVWRKMLNISYFKNQYPDDYFAELCKRPPNEHTEQIELDIPRTFPNHKRFFTQRSKKDLLNVLQSYSYHNEKVGYCQGMSYIAGVLLMFLSPEDTFWLLVALLERETMGYYMPGMPQLISDSQLFQKILEIENKPLGLHLINNGIDPILYVTPWWMCFFTTLQDWGAVLRLWDLILLEGVNSLFRFSLVVLKYSAGYLFKRKGADGLLPYLLRPPIDDIGGIDFLLKTAMELPILDLVKEAKETIEKEKEEKLLKEQKLKEEKLLQQQQQQQQSALKKSSTQVENNSSNVFEKIIKFIDSVDSEFAESNTNYNNSNNNNNNSNNNSSNNNSSNNDEGSNTQQQQPQLKTPVKSGLFSKKIRDFTNRIKSRFAPNYGYQPCNVILEQKLSRKSIARRPSMAPGRHSIAQRKSIAPRKSILPPKQTIASEDINNQPDNNNNNSDAIMETSTNNQTTNINNNILDNTSNIIKKPRQSAIRRPSIITKQTNNNNPLPRQSISTRKSVIGRRPSIVPRKSIKPKVYVSKSISTTQHQPQYEKCNFDPLTGNNSNISSSKNNQDNIEDEWIESTNNDKDFNNFVIDDNYQQSKQQQQPASNNLLNSSREINKKYPTPSSPIPMIKPPPPSATPLLKILSPTNNSLNSSISSISNNNNNNNNNNNINGFKSINQPHKINNCNSSSNSLYSSPLRNQSFYKSPIKTPNHKTINQSVDLLKEIMKTPPNDNKWTTWVSSTNTSTIKTTSCQFGDFSFSSPQQNSPNVYEKQFLKEFSTPTPLKENNNYRNRNDHLQTPQTPSTNTKKRLLFNSNNLNHQNDQENRYIQQTPTKTPIKFLKTNNNNFNNNIINNNNIHHNNNNSKNNLNNNDLNNNNNGMDIDFESSQINSPSSYELKQINHQNFINNKQVKKWDLRV